MFKMKLTFLLKDLGVEGVKFDKIGKNGNLKWVGFLEQRRKYIARVFIIPLLECVKCRVPSVIQE